MTTRCGCGCGGTPQHGGFLRGHNNKRPADEFQRAIEAVKGDPDECWNWTRGLSPQGYGRMGSGRLAHRLAYELYVGSIPNGLVIDHPCRNRACVNPGHLEVVTMTENNRRGQGWSGRKAQQTHCINGHEFTPENTQTTAQGRHRRCATCHRMDERASDGASLRSSQPSLSASSRSDSTSLRPTLTDCPCSSTPPPQGFTTARCADNGVWATDLNITATNPELHPKATITFTGNSQPPVVGADVPYHHTYTSPAARTSFSATVHIVWDDSFTQDKGPFTATRPDGCTPPPTSGTTTTTTCAQAIPPRSDCAPTTEVTTSPSTSTPPSSTSTPSPGTSVPPATSAPSGPTTTSAGLTPSPSSPITVQRSIVLPTTGAGDWLLAVAAIGGIAILVGFLLVTAKRIDRSHEGEQ